MELLMLSQKIFAKALNLDPQATRQYILKSICKELDKYRKAFEYLRTGDREKLRSIVYSRRIHIAAQQLKTLSLDQSDASFNQKELINKEKYYVRRLLKI